MDIKNKRFLICGLGKSGLDSSVYLKRSGAKVIAYDESAERLREGTRSLLQCHEISVTSELLSIEEFCKFDIVVMSPGIKPSSQLFRHAVSSGVELISEIELAARLFKGRLIAVSGTDGKTTVTTLITRVLNNAGLKAVSCGNIGNTFINELYDQEPDLIAVVEVSSFQLYLTEKFHPNIAVLTNIAPDHLDWHTDMTDYTMAKSMLFRNQCRNDFAILNSTDELSVSCSDGIKAKIVHYDSAFTDLDLNQRAVMCVADILQLDLDSALDCLRNFKGIEHRMEIVPSSDDRIYINDSKSTTLNALRWALTRIPKGSVLICGGKNKGLDFSEVKDLVAAKIETVIVIGEASDVIEAAWKKIVRCIRSDSLSEALVAAKTNSKKGDTILFSPACASFDMFSNYMERGRIFKSLVSKNGGAVTDE